MCHCATATPPHYSSRLAVVSATSLQRASCTCRHPDSGKQTPSTQPSDARASATCAHTPLWRRNKSLSHTHAPQTRHAERPARAMLDLKPDTPSSSPYSTHPRLLAYGLNREHMRSTLEEHSFSPPRSGTARNADLRARAQTWRNGNHAGICRRNTHTR